MSGFPPGDACLSTNVVDATPNVMLPLNTAISSCGPPNLVVTIVMQLHAATRRNSMK